MNERDRQIKRIAVKELVGNKHYFDRKGDVKYHSDGYVHYLAKAAIGFILRKNSHEFATELEFPNGAIADVIDLNTFIVYELESNYSEKDKQEKYDNFWEYEEVRDIIVLDPQELSGDIKTMGTELESKLVL